MEVLDFCGPFEVFSVTRLNEGKRREAPSPFELHLIAENPDAVKATGGLRIIPDFTLEDCPLLDILVIPGGWGTRTEIKNDYLIQWIADRGKKVETLTSVCTGSVLLGRTGLLNGRHATTHWASLPWKRESYPEVTVEDQLHVLEDGSWSIHSRKITDDESSVPHACDSPSLDPLLLRLNGPVAF